MTLSVPFPCFTRQLAWWHNSCCKSRERCLTGTFERKVHAEETTEFATTALVLWAAVRFWPSLGQKMFWKCCNSCMIKLVLRRDLEHWHSVHEVILGFVIPGGTHTGRRRANPVTLRCSWRCCLSFELLWSSVWSWHLWNLWMFRVKPVK